MKATIIGATGLIGNELVNLLLIDDRIQEVVVFVRRTLGFSHEKLQEHIINFDKPEEWRELVTGDIFFSTLGTTMKQAGSKEAQYKVDHTYQYEFAKAASENGLQNYVLVSAVGADPKSTFFYSRMKGELEQDVAKLDFSSIHIIQPGLLHGDRNENRFGEAFTFYALNAVNALGLFKKYRPIHGKTVAQAMINAALSFKKGAHSYTLEAVFELSKQ
ncbi:MAG: NAD-dependent epimerase/dehydratase family protein [Balneolaceae bacterium]|nr:MAG: NAD-dependent epimerase/dehydratase family protein [Balneolaceae bacterium]